jgi:hypothetical protein
LLRHRRDASTYAVAHHLTYCLSDTSVTRRFFSYGFFYGITDSYYYGAKVPDCSSLSFKKANMVLKAFASRLNA